MLFSKDWYVLHVTNQIHNRTSWDVSRGRVWGRCTWLRTNINFVRNCQPEAHHSQALHNSDSINLFCSDMKNPGSVTGFPNKTAQSGNSYNINSRSRRDSTIRKNMTEVRRQNSWEFSITEPHEGKYESTKGLHADNNGSESTKPSGTYDSEESHESIEEDGTRTHTHTRTIYIYIYIWSTAWRLVILVIHSSRRVYCVESMSYIKTKMP